MISVWNIEIQCKKNKKKITWSPSQEAGLEDEELYEDEEEEEAPAYD